MEDNTLVKSSFLGNNQRADREGQHSVVVLYTAGIGIPGLLAGSLFRRWDYCA